MPLTARETRVLNFVAQAIDNSGIQPSYREICTAFGWTSPNSVASIVKNMERKKVITTQPGRSRAICFKWKEYLE